MAASLKTDKATWIWMPHAAHFILGDKCQFHLATYLNNGYIVSTVGELWPERTVREIHASISDPDWHRDNNHLKGDVYDAAYMKRFGFEEIGYHRTYETMVFKAQQSEECLACPYVIVSGENLDMDGYNDPGEVYKGHMAMCDKWSEREM